jgi:hypothetical protein
VRADDRQHRERERDVGRGRDGPAPEGASSGGQVDRDEEERGNQHASHGRQDRQRGTARVAEVAGDELALELQPGDEEEDGQQPVGGPGAEG